LLSSWVVGGGERPLAGGRELQKANNRGYPCLANPERWIRNPGKKGPKGRPKRPTLGSVIRLNNLDHPSLETSSGREFTKGGIKPKKTKGAIETIWLKGAIEEGVWGRAEGRVGQVPGKRRSLKSQKTMEDASRKGTATEGRSTVYACLGKKKKK